MHETSRAGDPAKRAVNLVLVLPEGRREAGAKRLAADVTEAVEEEEAAEQEAGSFSGQLRASCRQAGLGLEAVGNSLILTRQRQITRQYRRDAVSAGKVQKLNRQLESVGVSVPQTDYDTARKNLQATGTNEQLQRFEQIQSFSEGKEDQFRYETARVTYKEAGKKKAARHTREIAKVEAKARRKAAAAPGRGELLEARLRRTVLRELQLDSVTVKQALLKIGKLGKVKIRCDFGKQAKRLGIYAEKISVYESLRLICRATDLRLEFGEREVRVSAGPYTPEFETGVYRLSPDQLKALTGKWNTAEATMKAVLRKNGVNFPASSQFRYDPEQRVMIILNRPGQLQKVEALLR